MSNVIRTHPLMQLVCHICLVSLWTYWAIAIGRINDGVWGWIALIVVGLCLLLGGAYCLIMESDVSEGDDDDMHFFFYGIISMIPLGIILYNTFISPAPSYLFLGSYIGIFLLLYNFKSFSAGILLFTLTIIPLYVTCNFTRWYDYVIVGVITLVGFIMVLFTAGKSATNSTDLDNSDERALLLGCFFGWILYSLGTAYYLMGNQILSQDWLSIPFILFPFLLLLCATSRILTIIGGVIGSLVYIFINWNTISFNFIKDWFGSLWRWNIDGIKWICSGITTIWIEHTWVQWTVYSILGVLLLIGIIALINSLREARIETKVVYKEREHLLPMKYNGLYMTCPHCRRTMVKGKYQESKVRGVTKTATKQLLAPSIGAAIGGPVGFAIGVGVSYIWNKEIDKTVNVAFDMWNYEVEGGRTLYFTCPRPECGYTWEETEHYGIIDH